MANLYQQRLTAKPMNENKLIPIPVVLTVHQECQILNIFYEGYFREIKPMNDNKLIKIPFEIKIIVIEYIAKYNIYGIGKNDYGQLGMNKEIVPKWKQLHKMQKYVTNRMNIRNMYRNNNSMIIKTANNELYAIGYNGYNALGINNNDIVSVTEWTKISTTKIKNPEFVSAGISSKHGVFIHTLNGKLYASGSNYSGCFGNNDKFNYFTNKGTTQFIQINTDKWLTNDDKIIDIICGDQHSIFITKNKCAFSCGNNSSGQCFTSFTTANNKEILTPILIASNVIRGGCGHNFTALLKENGNVIVAGQIKFKNNFFKQNKIKISDLKCGSFHVLCLSDNHKVYTFGNNEHGQIGNGVSYNPYDDADPDNDGFVPITKFCNTEVPKPYFIDIIKENIVDIECGDWHSLLLTKSNNLWTFGLNENKQCSCLFKAKKIWVPHKFDKMAEIQSKTNYFINRVIGFQKETIIIIEPFKY